MSSTSLNSDLSSSSELPGALAREISRIAGGDVPLELSGVVEDAVSRQLSASSSKPELPVATLQKTRSIPKNYNPNLNLSPRHKLFIVMFSALSGFLSPMSGLAFLPAVPVIAQRFHTTGTIINISNAVYMVFMMMLPCIFSPISDIYGRRPTFLFCLVFYIISSVLVGVSQNLAMFFVFRCTTAIFGTAFFSVGAHVIGDIYLPVERGTAIGLNVLGAQLGPAIGPVIGGAIVTGASWRIIFFVMAGIGVFNLIGVFFVVPETCRETKMQQILRETGSKKKFIFVPFNPFRLLHSFCYPNLILAGVVSCLMLYLMYNLLTPIRYVVDPRFNLTSPIQGSLFYLAPGIGFLLGPYLGGRYADHIVKKYIRIKNQRVSEDRVRTCIIPLGIVMPAAVFIYGWSLEFKKGGYPVPIIALFVYAVAQTVAFPLINTYCVDSMPELGGDAIGGNYFIRYCLAVASSASCLPAIDSIGVGWTCSIGGFITLSGGVAALLLVRYGEQWRIEALKKRGLR